MQSVYYHITAYIIMSHYNDVTYEIFIIISFAHMKHTKHIRHGCNNAAFTE